MLSWSAGAVECRVVAAAGAYVLLRLGRSSAGSPYGRSSLTYLEGITPMGWDGDVEPGQQAGEVRFHLFGEADRRASVRLPVNAEVIVLQGGRTEAGRLLDISAGGLRFRHPGEFDRGSTIRVRLQLPGGPLVDADAAVRAAEPGLSCAEFATLHAATAADIGAWTVAQLRTAIGP